MVRLGCIAVTNFPFSKPLERLGVRSCAPKPTVAKHSSLTLFEAVAPSPLFAEALDRWFAGERDPATRQILAD